MKNNYLTKGKNAIKMLVAGFVLFSAFSSIAQTICVANFTYTVGANGVVNFQSTSTGTSSNTYYWWTFGAPSSVSGPTATHTFATNGMKSVCLYIVDSLAGCSDSKCDSVPVNTVGSNTVNPCSPSVVYTLWKDTTTALTWNAYPTYPAGITGATWSWGDGSSSSGLYPSHTYSAAGTYTTCVTVSVSCGTVTASYCYVAAIFRSNENNAMIKLNVKAKPTGIKSIEMNNDNLSIYPNPSNGVFTMELSGTAKESKSASLYIYNMLGEKVFERQVSGATKLSLDASALPEGTYFVKLVSDKGYADKKITIQK